MSKFGVKRLICLTIAIVAAVISIYTLQKDFALFGIEVGGVFIVYAIAIASYLTSAYLLFWEHPPAFYHPFGKNYIKERRAPRFLLIVVTFSILTFPWWIDSISNVYGRSNRIIIYLFVMVAIIPDLIMFSKNDKG